MCLHLIAPSPTQDFSGEVELHPVGLGEGPWALVTPVKAIKIVVGG